MFPAPDCRRGHTRAAPYLRGEGADIAQRYRLSLDPGLLAGLGDAERRQGVAHRLVEKAVSVAEEAGCRRVWGSMHDDDVRDLCPGSPLRTPNDVTAGPTTFVIPIP